MNEWRHDPFNHPRQVAFIARELLSHVGDNRSSELEAQNEVLSSLLPARSHSLDFASEASVNALFKTLDTNGDGHVVTADLVAGLRGLLLADEATASAEHKAAFKELEMCEDQRGASLQSGPHGGPLVRTPAPPLYVYRDMLVHRHQ